MKGILVIFQVLILLTLVSIPIKCANILFYHLSATASHRTSIWPLAKQLAENGHNITYVFPLAKRIGSHPKIEEIKPSKMFAAVEHFAGSFDINMRINGTVNKWMEDAFIKTVDFCEAFYDSPETKEWLARPNLHYDLIMMDSSFGQCAYGLVHKFKAKHVLFNPVVMPLLWDSFGVVPESSSIPEWFFNRKPSEMTSFYNRVLNTLAPLILRWAFIGTMEKIETIYKNKLGFEDMPSFLEIEQETSLVLQNIDFIDEYPMALPPMFVSYSGLGCTKDDIGNHKPLSKELESAIKDSDGFVYISFGSSVVASAMPIQLRSEFFKAFEKFPKLKFLWRWTGAEPEDKPANVIMQSWFSQKDVLAHSKIKAFITQAGRPSLQEAICYGVPMIALPVFGDQDYNADRLVHIGAAVKLEIADLKHHDLENALNLVAIQNQFSERLAELSTMYRDRLVDPLENSVYWVEYVLKYNTSLLKPLAMNQTWWQRRLLDVYALAFTVILVAVVLTFVVLKSIIRVFVGRVVLSQKNTKKTKTQ